MEINDLLNQMAVKPSTPKLPYGVRSVVYSYLGLKDLLLIPGGLSRKERNLISMENKILD